MRRPGIRRLGMDMFLQLTLAMSAILILILVFIAEPLKHLTDAPEPQGNLLVQIYWPDYHCDVDLWIKSPDNVVVGYSNKGAAVFNLLRDDLGTGSDDLSERNEEIAVSRGLPDGQYIINVHLFALKFGTLPVPVKLVIGLKNQFGSYKQIFVVDTELVAQGQEKTMARFRVRDGEIIRDSFNTIQQAIRSEAGFSPEGYP